MSDPRSPLGPPPSWRPPSGPPPTGPPPEILHSGGGGLPSSWGPSPRSRGLRRGLVIGAVLVGLAAVGIGGFFAWQALFVTGPQPAEALPADTIGYVSVDLDPSGSQKIAALETLNKFPAFKDQVGISSSDDLREKIFDAVEQDGGACQGVDFGRDVAPWLGDRLAVAAVPLDERDDNGEHKVAPVVVVQVTDAARADAGLKHLQSACGLDGPGGWSISGHWAVISSESSAVAQEVTSAAASSSLADDADFQHWTDEAGDPGILTAYVAPSAGDYLSHVSELFGGLGESLACDTTTSSGSSSDPGASAAYSSTPTVSSCDGQQTKAEQKATEAQVKRLLSGFHGAALTVRFGGGSLEVETVGGAVTTPMSGVVTTGRGGDVVQTLPSDTAVAIGFGLDPGWFGQLTDYVSTVSGGAFDLGSMLDDVQQETGLSFPDDAETLLGRSTAIAVGGTIDPDVFNDPTPAHFPFAVKVEGDPDAITGVLDKVKANPSLDADAKSFFDLSTDGDHAAAGPDSDYRGQVVHDGGLGDDATYRSVVEHSAEASTVVYVDFDVHDWLGRMLGHTLADDDQVQQVLDNLKPLKALGYSTWQDDGVSHGLLKITTD